MVTAHVLPPLEWSPEQEWEGQPGKQEARHLPGTLYGPRQSLPSLVPI